jgi:urea transport system permease protein
MPEPAVGDHLRSVGRSERRRYRAPPFVPLWALIGIAAVVALIGTYPYYGSNEYVLSLVGKFLCFAIFALSIDLIWGFAGILSLGQAVYFGIGAYFVALSLKINYALAHPTRYGGKFPDFMEWNGLTELPHFMTPLISTPFAVFCALSVPTLLGLLFGVITFKRNIYGVYCAVITLAESLILQEIIIEYQRLFELRYPRVSLVHLGGCRGVPADSARPDSFARRHCS